MRAISLWQPWASAVELGLKRIETRGWATKVRGPIAIHASARRDRTVMEFLKMHLPMFRMRLLLDGDLVFPFGAIVAVADLVDVLPCDERLRSELGAVEEAFGDFSDGRFAWKLANVRALPRPVPFKGRQGFFNVEEALLS